MAAGADRAGDHPVPRQLAPVAHHSRGDPAVDHHRGAVHLAHRADAQHHDAGRLRAGHRHPGRQRHGGDREHRAPRRDARAAASSRSSTAPSEVAVPTFLSTLCICIVFVPVFLLQGTAKYLFSPLSLSVIGALLASLALSFTMVPVLFNYLMRARGARIRGASARSDGPRPANARVEEPAGALSSRLRARLRALSRELPQHARLGAVAGTADRDRLCRR